MEKTGDTINLDDLKRGLGLGVGLEVPQSVRARKIFTNPDKLAELVDLDGEAELDEHDDSGVDDSSLHDSAQPHSTQKTPSARDLEPPEFFNPKPSIGERALRGLSPNLQSPRKVAFALAACENTDDSIAQEACQNTNHSIIQIDPTAHSTSGLQTPTIVKVSKRPYSERSSSARRSQVNGGFLRDRHRVRVSTHSASTETTILAQG